MHCFSTLKSSFIDIKIYKKKINEVESDINTVQIQCILIILRNKFLQ